MNKTKLIIYIFFSTLLLQGCSKILEPVLLIADSDNGKSVKQEEFDINIKALTFKNAEKANKDPYSRQIMMNASGTKANVFNETDFLTSDIPIELQTSDYFIGVGDVLSFFLMNEFINEKPKWPSSTSNKEYLLGIGDELTFSLLTDTVNSNMLSSINASIDELRVSKGIIGSDGNILLLGVGNIKALNRTLSSVRDEVRNNLIRSNFSPNFQLEISKFQSKKAYITNDLNVNDDVVIPITNLTISLKEVVLSAGLSQNTSNSALISLKRDNQNYQYTAGQIFDTNAPEVFIEDKDQIEIQNVKNTNEIIKAEIGSNGYILIPNVGKIKVVNKTIDQIQTEIKNILESKKLKPDFQLKLLKSANKKAYLINNKYQSKVINLTDRGITLKELLLNSPMQNSKAIDSLSVITLKRNKKVYRMTVEYLLSSNTPDIWVHNNDQIEVDHLPYKAGQVFALSGAGSAQIVPITPSKRESLADILFVPGGTFGNILAKRSEVYLLRGGKKSVAYHLDAQNVSRILVAAKTELRPNDIIFVADRPIISFSRALSEITPLRILLRDIESGNIP